MSGIQVRQSDLASYSRCPQQKKLVDQYKADAGGKQPEQLSMTAYGSVMHHAIHVMEKLHFDKRSDAVEKAHATFDYYWDPANITAICDSVTIWAARQTWAGLARKGHQTIDLYAKYLQTDVSRLLGLELEFNLPFELDGEQHIFHGTMDRLSLRKLSGTPYLNIEDFKGLALDTPLPTPTGWTTMGAVQVGDQVIGSDGRPTTVVIKSSVHAKPCFRMTFDDGSSVVCDEDHLWKTVAGQRGESEAVRDVLTLRRELFAPVGTPRGGSARARQRHQRVLNTGPLALPEVDLPVHPYVYGCWLGDGRKKGGEISGLDDELFDRIASFGYKVGPNIGGQAHCRASTVYGLRTALRDANLLGHRVIPDAYLRASYYQRLWLLRGLMDTDGSWHKARHRAVFTTCDKALGESVRELVVSLGWKASVFQVVRTGFGLTVDAWDVCFTPTDANPFALSRKTDLVRFATTAQSSRRVIYSIEPVVMVPTQCIQVDAPDSMYLCGEGMIPTHNTGRNYGTRKGDLRWNAQFSGYCIDGETPVLMGDGEWKPIRDVSVGDQVMGFDEHTSPSRRRWHGASVLHKWTTEKESLRLTFDDGRQVVCSGDHRWLSRSNSALWQRLRKAGGDAWVEAGALRVGDELAAVFAPQVIKHDSHDYMRGYVAGACLGDGSFDPTRIRRVRSSRVESLAPYWSILVAEEDVAIINRLEGYFDALGIVGACRIRREPNVDPRASSFAGTKPMVGLRTDRLGNCERLGALMEEVDSDEYRAGWLAGLYDTDGSLDNRTAALTIFQKDWNVLGRVQLYAKALGFRFKFEAGVCDYVRLSGDRLQRYRFSLAIRPALDRKVEHLDGRTVRIFEPVRVASIESMGVRQLFDITTSTATFVANGVLSHNCWATTQPKFWTDAWGQEEGAELFTRFSVLARRATWISLKNGVDRQDAGWRGPQDYARFWAAIREYVKAVKADIYPLSLKGDVCFYCAFREGICGGVAVPDEDHGRPEPRPVKA